MIAATRFGYGLEEGCRYFRRTKAVDKHVDVHTPKRRRRQCVAHFGPAGIVVKHIHAERQAVLGRCDQQQQALQPLLWIMQDVEYISGDLEPLSWQFQSGFWCLHTRQIRRQAITRNRRKRVLSVDKTGLNP